MPTDEPNKPADAQSRSMDGLERKIGCIGHDGECCKDREQEKIDAARYRWLRDRLAIEDIERIEREFFGEPEEAESVKTDMAVDSAMRSNVELRGCALLRSPA